MSRKDGWKKKQKSQETTISIPGLDQTSGIKDHLKFLRDLKKDLKTTKPIRQYRNKRYKKS